MAMPENGAKYNAFVKSYKLNASTYTYTAENKKEKNVSTQRERKKRDK